MTKSSSKERLKITPEEWEVHELFQKASAEQKLTWLDQMRELMMEVWKNNPDARRDYEFFKQQGL